jgi:hypothetical protein
MSQNDKINLQPNDEELLASKKKKLHPRPDNGDVSPYSSKKKKKTSKKSSRDRATSKKCEVTFSEEVQEIKGPLDGINFSANKENNGQLSTPLKERSDSKKSYKSVREHVKTPYSKLKEQTDSILNTPITPSETKNEKPHDSKLKSVEPKETPKSQMKSEIKSAKKLIMEQRITLPKEELEFMQNITPTKTPRLEQSKIKSSPLIKISEEKESEVNSSEALVGNEEKPLEAISQFNSLKFSPVEEAEKSEEKGENQQQEEEQSCESVSKPEEDAEKSKEKSENHQQDEVVYPSNQQ